MTDVATAEAGVPFFVVASGPSPRAILRTGRCPMEDVNRQAWDETEVAIMGLADDVGQAWDAAAGELVEIAGGLEPSPPPAIDEITPRQLFIGLMRAGFVTAEEAVAAATTGAIPTAVAVLIEGLPADDEAAARITWARMQVVRRADPLVALLAAARGLSPADVDAFFATCAAI